MIITTRAYARAGLVGNPSDGYFGKTISVIVRNFSAEVTLYESPELEICCDERLRYDGIRSLVSDVDRNGYYGASRLIKAIIKRFALHCAAAGIRLDKPSFTIRYRTDIPRRVGLAGSSAIITATLRALMRFYGVDIPRPVQPSLILAAERDELNIQAGLQDRVIQTYEGVVYMDFSRELIERDGYGRYEPLDPALLPPLFVAYSTDLGEGSEVMHNNIRERYDRGEPAVVDAMQEFAALAARARDALLAGRPGELGPLMSRNFDIRRSIYNISPRNVEMIEIARRLGAHAKFAGSGGAAIGTYAGEDAYEALAAAYRAAGYAIIKPAVIESPQDGHHV